MIRLKTLLTEQSSTPKLRVLFVGDHQTTNNWSYARQLIKDGSIRGKIVGWSNSTTAQLYRILKMNLSKRYDVISIMGGDSDAKSMDPNTAITNLQRCYELAKKYKAKVVAISNPSKMFLQPTDKYYDKSLYASNDIISDWITSQGITDVAIDTSNFTQESFARDNYQLNPVANRTIASEWKSQVMALNIVPRSKKYKYTSDNSIKLGDSGESVKAIQEMLITLNYKISWGELGVNVFGITTLTAVAKLQKDAKLPITGIVDKATLDVMKKAIELLDSEETEDTDEARSDKLSGGNQEYIDRFATIAMEQMKKYNIPASIILAQGILESGNGTSDLTVYAYNHFGIKGSYNGQTWCGKTSEYVKGKKTSTKACFRKYPNDEASFEDHSELLTKPLYQTKVKKMASGVTDYKGWAKALQSAGYATSPTYANTLIKTIESLNLQKYDTEALGGLNTPSSNKASETNFKPEPSTKGKNGYLTASQLKSIGNGLYLSPSAADAYLAMKTASFEDGLKDSDWDISDAYRTYDEQSDIFDWDLYNRTGKKAKIKSNGSTAAAYPGTSNHGFGLAIDISGKSQDWIRKNGEPFGWSWDEGKSVGEPWHFRYKF